MPLAPVSRGMQIYLSNAVSWQAWWEFGSLAATARRAEVAGIKSEAVVFTLLGTCGQVETWNALFGPFEAPIVVMG